MRFVRLGRADSLHHFGLDPDGSEREDTMSEEQAPFAGAGTAKATTGVGAAVTRLREARGWSQMELQRRADVPQATIYKIEAGVTKSPGVDVVRKLARAFGVSPLALIDHELAEEREAYIVDAPIPATMGAGLRHPVAYRIGTHGLEGFGFRRGDTLIVDLGRRPLAREFAVVTRALRDGTGETFVRRWLEPWYVAPGLEPPFHEREDDVAVLGVVAGVIRPDERLLTTS